MSAQPQSIDIAGRRITNRDLHQAMRINILAGSLGTAWFAMTLAMPLTMFMEAIGASGVLIGLITTVRLLGMAAQVPAALVAENLSSRKRFWAPLAIAHRLLWFGVAAIALLWKPSQWWVPIAAVALVGLSDLLGNMGAAPWFSWMADLIPVKTSGRFWGTRLSIVTTTSLGGMALAGYLLDRFRDSVSGATAVRGFGVVFAIAAALGVADIVVHLWVKEPRPVPPQRHMSILKRIGAPFGNRDFRNLTFALAAWNFGCALVVTFGIVVLKRDFFATYSQLAWISIFGSFGSVLTSFVFGALVDRLGARLFCALLFLAAPLPATVWFFMTSATVSIPLPFFGAYQITQAILLQYVASFFTGSIFAAVGICQMRLAPTVSNASGRTISMALHWSCIGLIAALAPVTGGAIMDWFAVHPFDYVFATGTHFSFFHLLIPIFLGSVWCVALPLLLSIRSPATEMPFGEAVARMFVTNPLQAARNFYNINLICGPTTSRERALAVRELGVHRSEMAVPDLIEKLNDPSMDVQEGAIEALGAIGTPDSVDALVACLDDPGCDLRPQICRALRQAVDPRSVDALVRNLTATDRETLTESVRALGAIGDRRAISHLLNLIKNTRDNKVLAASSEALASLGELSAAYQIIPQMRLLPNRMLKRALAVAAGDLLGEREVFYKLLIAETESAGSGIGGMLFELARSVRRSFPTATAQLDTIARLEGAYLDRQVSRCAEMLLHLGLHLVQFIHRLPLSFEPNDVMQALLDRDRRAALGIWYLKILNETWLIDGDDSRDLTDVLLGIHIIAAIVKSHTPAGARTIDNP